MSTRDELDRRLASWMAETASGRPPAGGLEEAIEATRRRRPRPRWLAPLGSDWVGTDVPRLVVPAWPRLSRQLVTAAIVALLLAVAIVGAALIGAQLLRPDRHTWRLGGLAYSVTGDIYVAAADGGQPVLIADGTWDSESNTGGSYYWDPQWSPDGRFLAYGGSRVIHVVDPQGVPVASFPGWYSRWAPDSARIATWRSFPDTVDIRAPDGLLLTTVAIPAGRIGSGDQPPEWSPDGRAIVMARTGLTLPLDGSAHSFNPDPLINRWRRTETAKGQAVLPGRLTDPRLSPDGDRIAVTWRQGDSGPGTIMILNFVTGTAQTIHSFTSMFGDAVDWSPDGRAVLVIQGDGGRLSSIWSVPTDGSGGHVLVERADYEGADWRWVREDPRPDTQAWRLGSLAYEIDGDIYLADADGANARRVADGVPWVEGGGPSYGLDQPVWAPDGRHFLFVEIKGAPHQLTTHISDADGRVVASIPNIWIDATWSPDSTRLQAWIGNLDSTRIGIYGIDGVQQASLPVPDGFERRYEYGGAWAPDGRSVWVRITMFSDGSASSSALWQLPIDGSAPRQLAQDDPISRLYGLTFSRDGSRIAGTTLPDDSLVVANADGSDLRTVEPGAAPGANSGRVVDPIWSLTGSQVGYVAALDEQTSDIRVVDVQIGTTRTLLAGLRTIGSPPLLGLSPAGDRILFTQLDDQDRPSLWTVNAEGGGQTLLVVGASSGEWQWVPVP